MKQHHSDQWKLPKFLRIILILLCVFVALLALAFLPILFSSPKICVYDDALLGTSQSDIAAEWTQIYRQETDGIAMDVAVYELYQRGDEQMAAVFTRDPLSRNPFSGDYLLSDYIILNQTTGEMRGSVSSEDRTLSTWLDLRFRGSTDNSHCYDVGSGTEIYTWLTCEGHYVIWWDTAESYVNDVFTMRRVPEYGFLTGLNTIVHLPYTIAMMVFSMFHAVGLLIT